MRKTHASFGNCLKMRTYVAKRIPLSHFSSLRLYELCRQQAILTRQIITTFMTRPIDWGVSDLYSTAVVLSTPKGHCGSGEKHRCRAKGHGMHLFSVSCSLVFLSPPLLPGTSNASIVICESRNKPVQPFWALGVVWDVSAVSNV